MKPFEKLLSLYHEKNIADKLDEEQLRKIGEDCHRGYMIDESSRDEWKKQMKESIDMARQVKENVSYPWENAANVKYPLLTKAVTSYVARAISEVVQDNLIVKTATIGADPQQIFKAMGDRVSRTMSYQMLVESNEYLIELERIFTIQGIAGTAYKKTYYDPILKRNRSLACLPDEVVVNDNIRSIEDARRISHVIYKYKNDIKTNVRLGLYCDVPIEMLQDTYDTNYADDTDPPLKFCEQHTFIDLDDDGYAEPYIVIFHINSKKVLRIEPRFDLDDIQFDNETDKNIVYIDPTHYFTDYHLILSMDGKFHSLGFGLLLLPINETVNTTVNEMLDSGSLQNLPCGFIGRGARMKGGDLRFRPGEWKFTDGAPGTDLKNQIMPLPVGTPSQALFNLLQLMIDAGEQISSITDIMQGEQPAPNTPATSTLAALEQGLKEYGAIQKRNYASMTKEFHKWERLNYLFLDEAKYQKLLNMPQAVSKQDFNCDNLNVVPVADPTLSNQTQRLIRAQAIMQTVQMLSPPAQQFALKLYYQALNLTDQEIQMLLPPPDPNQPPPPEVQKTLAETEHTKAKTQEIASNIQSKQVELQQNEQKIQIEAVKVSGSHEKSRNDSMVDLHDQMLKQREQALDERLAMLEQQNKAIETHLEMMHLVLENKKIENDAQKAKADARQE